VCVNPSYFFVGQAAQVRQRDLRRGKGRQRRNGLKIVVRFGPVAERVGRSNAGSTGPSAPDGLADDRPSPRAGRRGVPVCRVDELAGHAANGSDVPPPAAPPQTSRRCGTNTRTWAKAVASWRPGCGKFLAASLQPFPVRHPTKVKFRPR